VPSAVQWLHCCPQCLWGGIKVKKMVNPEFGIMVLGRYVIKFIFVLLPRPRLAVFCCSAHCCTLANTVTAECLPWELTLVLGLSPCRTKISPFVVQNICSFVEFLLLSFYAWAIKCDSFVHMAFLSLPIFMLKLAPVCRKSLDVAAPFGLQDCEK